MLENTVSRVPRGNVPLNIKNKLSKKLAKKPYICTFQASLKAFHEENVVYVIQLDTEQTQACVLTLVNCTEASNFAISAKIEYAQMFVRLVLLSAAQELRLQTASRQTSLLK